MSWFRPKNILDDIFEGSIILKGISGLLEFTGGLLLFFIKPEQINHFIVLITQRELFNDPDDKIANFLINSAHHITSSGETFAIIYLWIHAAVKITAVIGLLRNKLWAYPFSLITLGAMMLYQAYSIFFVRASIGMIVLTIFDFFVLWLIWREYGKFKRSKTEDNNDDKTN